MIQILIIENEEQETSSFHNTLNFFNSLEVSTAKNYTEALDTIKKHYFDIIFFDLTCKDNDCINAVAFNSETLVIVFNANNNIDSEREFLSLGAKDYIKRDINTDLLKVRIENYIEIVQLRKKRLYSSYAINLFNENIFQRTVTFHLNSSTAIVEFWDYSMYEHIEAYENIKESVGVLYAIGTWLFKNNFSPKVFKEFDHDNLYFTLMPVDSLSENIIKSLILKNDKEVTFLKKDDKLSLKLKKITDQSNVEKKSNV